MYKKCLHLLHMYRIGETYRYANCGFSNQDTYMCVVKATQIPTSKEPLNITGEWRQNLGRWLPGDAIVLIMLPVRKIQDYVYGIR